MGIAIAMRFQSLIALSSSVLLCQGLAAFAQGANNLVSNKSVAIERADFEAHMQRVPADMRDVAMADAQRNARVVEALFVNRALAEKAKQEGLDKDSVIARRIQLQTEGFLATQYLELVSQRATIPKNLDERAREIYQANPAAFLVPEAVRLEHILVDLYGRTKEMALDRAKEARAKAAAGEGFLALAKQYSDDPSFIRNRGDLGFVTAKDVTSEIAETAFKSLKDGELSEPFFSKAGYHIVRRVETRPARQRSFDEVRASLVEAERDRIRTQAAAILQEEIRTGADVSWNDAAMAAITKRLTPEQLQRANQEALRKQMGPPSGR